MENIEAKVKTVDVLPMVWHYIDKLELYSIFQKYIPKPKNSKLEPAQVLCMMVTNIICATKPLYMVEEWLADYTDGLSEQPLNASLYNDDQLGRTTDRLFDADRASMLTEISAKAIEIYNLETNQIHNDSTSVTLIGKYNIEDSASVKLTQGFNKDHRPDCKQIVFGLNITADGYVPISFQLFDGNRTDDTTHIPNWQELSDMLGKEDFIYVADCKLCSAENLAYIAGNDGIFITILPRNRVQVKKFYEQLMDNPVEWQDAYSVPNSRKKDQLIVYQTHESSKTPEGYRIIWVHSSSKEVQDRNRRENRIKKVEQELEELRSGLNKYYLKTKDRIQDAVDKKCKGVKDIIQVKIVEEKQIKKVQTTCGKPGPKTEYREVEIITYDIKWQIDDETVEKKSRTDGIFPLITNSELEASKVLQIYKEQPYLEKKMNTTKSILEIAPVFLKLPRRIEAITFLYFVALMIISLIERNIRRNMQIEGSEKLPILPQGMNTKRPTWNNLNYFFRNVHLSIIEVNGSIQSSTVKGFTKLHEKICRLIEVPFSVYQNLQNNWWQFDSG